MISALLFLLFIIVPIIPSSPNTLLSRFFFFHRVSTILLLNYYCPPLHFCVLLPDLANRYCLVFCVGSNSTKED